MTAPLPPQSGFLPAGAVRVLRARAERGMTARVEVQRRVRVKTGPATYTTTWATVSGLAAVRCAFRPATTPTETLRADAVAALAEYEVQLPHGTAVDESHRLVIGHKVPGVVSPIRLEVTGVERTTQPEIVRRVYGRAVTEAAG